MFRSLIAPFLSPATPVANDRSSASYLCPCDPVANSGAPDASYLCPCDPVANSGAPDALADLRAQLETYRSELAQARALVTESRALVSEMQRADSQLFIPTQNSRLPAYCNGFLMANKNDVSIQCDELYPHLTTMPNLAEVRLQSDGRGGEEYVDSHEYDAPPFALPTVRALDLPWPHPHRFHVMKDYALGAQYLTEHELPCTQDEYVRSISNHVFKCMPGLERLVVRLDYKHRRDIPRTAQHILEAVEFHRLQLTSLTVRVCSHEPFDMYLLVGLRAYCERKNIDFECVID